MKNLEKTFMFLDGKYVIYIHKVNEKGDYVHGINLLSPFRTIKSYPLKRLSGTPTRKELNVAPHSLPQSTTVIPWTAGKRNEWIKNAISLVEMEA